MIQWHLYKATTKFCGLSRQVVFHDRENEHDFVKPCQESDEMYVFILKLSWSLYTGPGAIGTLPTKIWVSPHKPWIVVVTAYGSGHETVAVLLPGFAIIW